MVFKRLKRFLAVFFRCRHATRCELYDPDAFTCANLGERRYCGMRRGRSD